MRHIREKIAVLIIAITGCSVFSTPSQEKQAQYFAGVFILQSSTGLSAAEKAKKYRALEALTGITTRAAQALLADYRTWPAEWQTLHDSILTIITRVQPAVKADAAPALPAQRR